jgi:hypothetical protein
LNQLYQNSGEKPLRPSNNTNDLHATPFQNPEQFFVMHPIFRNAYDGPPLVSGSVASIGPQLEFFGWDSTEEHKHARDNVGAGDDIERSSSRVRVLVEESQSHVLVLQEIG